MEVGPKVSTALNSVQRRQYISKCMLPVVSRTVSFSICKIYEVSPDIRVRVFPTLECLSINNSVTLLGANGFKVNRVRGECINVSITSCFVLFSVFQTEKDK